MRKKLKIRKKLIGMILAASMCVGTLAGCGSNEATNEKPSQSEVEKTNEVQEDSSSASTKEVVELEEKTIQLMLCGPGKQADSDKVWDAFNEMLQEYVPNTKVEFTIVPFAEYKDTYNRVLAAEEGYDLVWTGYSINVNESTKNGDLMPLDDLLDEYGLDIKETLGENTIDMHRYSDGNLYYLISWQGVYGNKRAFRMPTELVEIVEKKYPNWLAETQKITSSWFNDGTSIRPLYEQLDKYFEALLEVDRCYAGIGKGSETVIGSYQYGRTLLIKHHYGVGVLNKDPDFKVVDSYQSEDYRATCEYAAKWFKDGAIPADIMSTDAKSYHGLKNGEYDQYTLAIQVHNLWTESQKLTYEREAGVPMSFIPIEDEGTLMLGSDTSMGIPYCADEPERGMMVLNAIYAVPELYQLLIYGFEGTHYTKNADGTITHVGLASASSPYGLADWYIGTCKNGFASDPGRLTFYDELAEAEKTAKPNLFISFVYDDSKTKDIITSLGALDKEYADALRLGVFGDNWEAKLDEFIKLRKEAGVDRLIEDYQAQLDAYMKENNIEKNITSW